MYGFQSEKAICVNYRISNRNSISTYLHCGKCLEELPVGVSPRDYQRIQVGFTEVGLQVWCVRHDMNVAHIHFQGAKHPANLTAYVGKSRAGKRR